MSHSFRVQLNELIAVSAIAHEMLNPSHSVKRSILNKRDARRKRGF